MLFPACPTAFSTSTRSPTLSLSNPMSVCLELERRLQAPQKFQRRVIPLPLRRLCSHALALRRIPPLPQSRRQTLARVKHQTGPCFVSRLLSLCFARPRYAS
ncbi:hypothetical protein LZ30DRAFT_290077 [Colletotrichum cereale]|nr:hypothetical protein LZ30DRAFT_290077 [Colletotrichum cereale]